MKEVLYRRNIRVDIASECKNIAYSALFSLRDSRIYLSFSKINAWQMKYRSNAAFFDF